MSKARKGAMDGVNDGQMMPNEPFGKPMDSDLVSAPIEGVGGGSTNLGEKTGFQTAGYIDKKGTPYGEAAKFNYMPPGMEIDNQCNAEINAMPMKKVVDMSYPGDGW